MSIAAQPLTPEDPELSPWWLRTVLIVMVLGFAGLLAITALAYRNAPPIPARVVDAQGSPLFSGDDVRDGQAVFLKYGLMDNGSIWGHGAYLGPDYSAAALHRIGEDTAAAIAQQQHQQPLVALTPGQQAAVRAETAVELKTNRYNAASDTLQLTAAEAAAYRQQLPYWTDYFLHPERNGGLKAGLITDPAELHQFTAFVTWAAWASVANRPGENYSYTNNFPYDPAVGNIPVPGALLWSALSLIVLLAGIAVVLLMFGKFDYLGWISRGQHIHPHLLPGVASPGQRALVKFFVVVALLFLAQTLVGGAVAHYRADPGSFYGFQLETIFPSNLMRTWHLQTAVFWIATAYVAAALFLGRTLRSDEPRWFAPWVHLLFGAFVVVIGGSLLGEWLGISQMLGKWWFWLGNQGWEFLELGRIWQLLLVVGLLVWFALLWLLVRPRTLANPESKPLVKMFLFAAVAIPVFYIPALFFGAKTNYTVVDTWRFWIIHLWVEGFFEFFATTVVALTFYQLGLTRRNVALRVIYLDGILYFLGGLIGTGHHWYFTGQTSVNMALSAMISVLEVVPLTLLTLDAWDFVRTTRGHCEICGKSVAVPHRWTFYFLIAVGVWNFVGAGIFGFLINLPIVSYYEVGTQLTPNHGHAAMMGVFGMLALALMVFVLRQTSSDERWAGMEKYVRTGFWGTNIGLAMMVVFSLFPSGVLQVWDVIQHGYWHARALDYIASPRSHLIEWMRLPGDLVFIIFGAIPLTIAAVKGWLGVRATPPSD
ncbi:cbb3-type cytochrome c oxidase subunit I [Rhodanobacter denitrificans]|uniref:Nitric oxide reductase large subunit n=1 Tax=Rhodanobacter denitrificans TaxID=666685 RepID=I4WS67_9GAMM|nr:cbb3-type cytochrome c oxidase subunit I [Rhodanobacter denitrificans]AGG89396.1 nitric oxide reductase large subunit [Rhodanobacter denitrificans]EIM02309.1 nitric-oxide reductase subunit B [Rhodanobacter denitrificans]UJM88278.1 cbb3-type cytochrome c oxidase subunit I [Rhodanobacter denitrificans]UJM88708.1 cbb3-type cytochrome c oxidase subunit I [Rhodanobacter denitrificans]